MPFSWLLCHHHFFPFFSSGTTNAYFSYFTVSLCYLFVIYFNHQVWKRLFIFGWDFLLTSWIKFVFLLFIHSTQWTITTKTENTKTMKTMVIIRGKNKEQHANVQYEKRTTRKIAMNKSCNIHISSFSPPIDTSFVNSSVIIFLEFPSSFALKIVS